MKLEITKEALEIIISQNLEFLTLDQLKILYSVLIALIEK